VCLLCPACVEPGEPGDDDDVTTDDDLVDDDLVDDDSATDDDVTSDDDSAPADDLDGDGWTVAEGDCDDADASIHPGADEILCDGVDSDCDGSGEGVAAVVDGWEFDSIASAMLLVPDSGSLLVCPGTHTEQVTVQRDMTLTSFSGDPDDTILDGEETRTVVYIGADFTVTVSHLTIRNGLGEAWIAGDHAGGGIMAMQTASLTVEDCAFETNKVTEPSAFGAGLAFYRHTVTGPSSLRVSGCRFEDNAAGSIMAGTGGAIWIRNSNDDAMTVEIVDCTFIGNNAFHSAGAVEVKGSETDDPVYLSIDGCTFDGNDGGNGDGGALLVDGWASVDITDTVFSTNRSGNYGGGAYLYDVATGHANLTIVDTTFDGNSTTINGGALSFHGSEATDEIEVCLDGVSFSGNEALNRGGAIGMDSSAVVSSTVTGVTFTDNFADVTGGAVSLSPSGLGGSTIDWRMDGGSFTGNQATEAGSVFFASAQFDHPTEVSLTGVLIDGNTVTSDDRGALYTMNPDMVFVLDSCTVTSNVGGGAYLWDEIGVRLTSTDTDWGSGVTDNTPYDVQLHEGATYDAFGASASFTCIGSQACQ